MKKARRKDKRVQDSPESAVGINFDRAKRDLRGLKLLSNMQWTLIRDLERVILQANSQEK